MTPSSGTLDVGESMQVTVDFNPMTVGDHSQDLVLHYHTGESISDLWKLHKATNLKQLITNKHILQEISELL